MPRSWAAGVAFLCIAAAPPLASEAAGQSPQDSTRSVVLARALDEGWRLRLSTSQDTIVGRVLDVRADSVRVVGSQRISIGEITGIQREQKEGGGARLGAVVGAAALGSLGYLFSGLCEGGGCGTISTQFTVGGALLGGVLGGFAGHAMNPPDRTLTALWP